MKGKFWRKALAASLALLIVSGSTPIKPLSQVFDRTAITASAFGEYDYYLDFMPHHDQTEVNEGETVLELHEEDSFVIYNRDGDGWGGFGAFLNVPFTGEVRTFDVGGIGFYIPQDGKYVFTLTDKGEGNWFVSVLYSLENCTISDIPDQTYTGSAITPEITVTDGEKTLTLGTDYEVTYSDNTNAGTAKATITGKGNYGGTIVKTFAINKATPTVTAPTANTLTYNGGEQELVTAGSTNFGKVLYSLDGETYSEEVPKGTSAGDYTVFYKVEGSDNWNAVDAATVEVTIAESYTITWKNGDETLETDNYVPGGATPEYNGETPTKADDTMYSYSFAGWSPNVSAVSENAEYTATFTSTPKTYNVTYKVDGVIYGDVDTVAYGTALTARDVPARDGYISAVGVKSLKQCLITILRSLAHLALMKTTANSM